MWWWWEEQKKCEFRCIWSELSKGMGKNVEIITLFTEEEEAKNSPK